MPVLGSPPKQLQGAMMPRSVRADLQRFCRISKRNQRYDPENGSQATVPPDEALSVFFKTA